MSAAADVRVSDWIRLRRALARRILPIALNAAAPLLRAYMQNAPSRSSKRWLWEHLIDPYVDRMRPFRARTAFGARLDGRAVDHIQRRIFASGLWEPNLTRWIVERLRPGDVFVDVGANIGYFSLLGARCVGATGRVVAIEASPSIYRTLCAQLALNGARNVRAVQCAVFDRETELTLYKAPIVNVGRSSVVETVGSAEACVRAAPLGAILTESELALARLVKIDVEGAEVRVVAGLAPLLGRMRADVEFVVETRSETYGDVRAIFAEFGFVPSLLPNPEDVFDAATVCRPAARPLHDDEPRPLPGLEVTDVVFSRRFGA